MLFILNLAIEAGSGLALSIPFLGWLEGAVHKRMREAAQKDMAQCSRGREEGKSEISGWHTAGVFVFAFLLTGILTLTGVPALQELHFDANVNLIPMAEFFSNFKQYFENILLFIPLGFLVPLLWRREQMVEKTVSIGFLFSLFIEAAQLFSFRATDIDDLLMNTMGTWLGYLLFLAVSRIFPRMCGRFGVGEKPEPGSLWAEEEADGPEVTGEADAENAWMETQIVNEECRGSKNAGQESPVCRYEMELSFAIVVLLMMTLQPLLGSVLWDLWYGFW
ncbi:VanZ family protein [Eisenbergiella sp.]